MSLHGMRVFLVAMSILALLASAALTIPTPTGPPNPEPVHGRIEHTDGVRVVHVFGTPDQMGYAHGWLVGEDFVIGLQELFEQLPSAAVGIADFMRSWTPMINLTDAQQTELAAVYRGMQDRMGTQSMQIPGLDRCVDETDLLVWNGYDMFRAVGCSGFSAWGKRTKDGEVITARTLDLAVLSPHWVESQILLVRHPAEGKATACITPVGLLGCMTGINEDGVCGFLHDGDGDDMMSVLEPERPVMFAIRDILERAAADDAFSIAEEELATQGPFPQSYMIRIVRPATGEEAARVYRLDAEGHGRNDAAEDLAITTNHYITGDTTASVLPRSDSHRRYAKIARICGDADSDSTVTCDTAWEAIRRVAADHQRFKTLHAMVARPVSGEVQICVARRDADGILRAATTHPPAIMTLNRLFDAPPPMLKLRPTPGIRLTPAPGIRP
ncbi:MAG: C45 family autoproteolytic acyltransferase/hydrolase, partial [Phycisphaerales bacterium]|nr:C45 family autoproteolytic acyltransferase/hydrolase [Phycisphaerales bacterium]